MVAATTVAITKAVAPAVTDALKTITPTILNNIGKAARGTADRAIVSLQIGFQEYLTTSYNKCKSFKSILSPQAPLDVLSHYVNVKLECNKKTILDTDLLNGIFTTKRAVVTGLAGSGKSMFMKYFTISHFENPRGAVPLFVELRHLNSFTDVDLLTFVRSSCTSKSHNVTANQFELSLRAGAFILILDGFDELNHEIRDEIQKQILALEKDYPNAPVVISSRPDDRFLSWTSYYVY